MTEDSPFKEMNAILQEEETLLTELRLGITKMRDTETQLEGRIGEIRDAIQKSSALYEATGLEKAKGIHSDQSA